MEYPIDPAEIRKMAQSPAGQQLISMLQKSGGENLQRAMNKASQGDYGDAKAALSRLLSSPEIQNLLRQLEEEP